MEAGTDTLTTAAITSSGAVDLDADAQITLGGLVKTASGNIDVDTSGGISLDGGLDTSNAGATNAGTLSISASEITLAGNSILRTNSTSGSDSALTLSSTIDGVIGRCPNTQY